MILIGSRAAKIRLGNNFSRPCIDFDWVCTKEEFDTWLEKESHKVNPTKVYELPEFNKWIVEGSTNCEFEIIKPGSSNELLMDLVKNNQETLKTTFGLIPNIDLLFTIKSSHRFKKFQNSAQGWYKTMIDYHCMKNCGAKIKPEYEVFLKLRESETYTYSHPSLMKSKNDFFQDDFYVYQHDDIHMAIKVFEKPAYQYFQADNAEVACDMKKFWSLPREIQLASVVEEATTLCLERGLIKNFDKWSSPKACWQFALAKTLSSITSGKWRAWGYDNIFDVIKLFSEKYSDFYEKFQQSVREGSVRYIEGYDKNM